ncbi:protein STRICTOSIDINE SYNTHASE-LIKE 3-like [Triticum dicoccoides]|uniref:protein STRICTOSIDINE SYNTHASE-LIKE 3-like n=1 Tax=Triticum dicoccoides TaxID=85692 RepID=UPI001890E048|nr:protein STRICTOSIDINE SYNTHASE-LIKE 3-like [Triticum dicoccoides]
MKQGKLMSDFTLPASACKFTEQESKVSQKYSAKKLKKENENLGCHSVPLRFTNGVDIDQVTDDVYFTDSSRNYNMSQHEMVIRNRDSRDHLTRYDPRTGNAGVLQAGITYPNEKAELPFGVDSHLLALRIDGDGKIIEEMRGPKSNQLHSFAPNQRPGTYWVALHREKAELPFGIDSHLLALRIDVDGKIIEEMRGPKGVRPTEVVERKGGRLFMGSVELHYVSVVTRK